MESDHFSVRVVIIALALVVVGGLGSIVFLSSTQTPIPDALDRLIFSALGALGAVLARTSSSSGSTPVEITNTPAEPVPVEETALPPVA